MSIDYNSITIGGNYFWFQRRGRLSIRVYNEDMLHATFRTPEAATRHIISSLSEVNQKRVAREEKEEERRKKRKKQYDLNTECENINEHLDGTNCKITADSDNETFSVSFTYKDKSTALAAIDYLQDGGFCGADPKKITDQEFLFSQAQYTAKQLTLEQKRMLYHQLMEECELEFEKMNQEEESE